MVSESDWPGQGGGTGGVTSHLHRGEVCGRRAPVAASKVAATESSADSLRARVTICRPDGQAVGVKPAGTDMAGTPSVVIRYDAAIQSR